MKLHSKIGLFLSLLLLMSLASCKKQEPNHKFLLNEVMVDNQSNFQDDYGMRSGWIEIFNRAYSTADLAGFLLRVSSVPGDTATYIIPKGDVLTKVRPRQHALFWADNSPRRGTFHTNFVLSVEADNWVGLYNSGRKLIDEVVVPAGVLKANQSYGRVSDAAKDWQVKDDSADKYVTPCTNNQTIESNPKMDKFEQHDPVGVGMAISAMSVVFTGLLLLFLSFRLVGKVSIGFSERNRRKAAEKQKGSKAGAGVGGATATGVAGSESAGSGVSASGASGTASGEIPAEVLAAISMALHEAQGGNHDVEDMVLTIGRVSSPWNARSNGMRELPQRNFNKR